MVFSTALPKIAMKKDNSTQDFIVQILAEEWPLTARSLYNRFINGSGKEVSYQAVHKTLISLVESEVVEKRGKEFLLSSRWIENLNSYSNDLKYRYCNNLSRTLDNKTFSFQNIYECDKFLFESFTKIASTLEEGEKSVVMQCRHAWVPLFITRAEYKSVVEALKMNKAFAVIKKRSKVDEWCCKFWKEQGMGIRFVDDAASLSDIYVIGDYVMEVYYSPELIKTWDDVYEAIKDISNMNVNSIFKDVFEKESRVVVRVDKNNHLASQLKEKLLGSF